MKHNKLFGMLAVAAVLAISACSGGGSSSKHTHYAAPDAPWQHDNNNHWKDCAENDKGKVDNAKHTFGDPFDVVPATCTATGSQKVKCSVCDAVVEQTIPMKEHNYGEWEVIEDATCTANGSRKHVCQDCQHEETETIQSPGHQWGEWETITEPTCEGKGKRQHTCSVCNEVAAEDIPALDHDLEAIGGETQPAPGEAAVRVYTCKRCGETFLGFKADEPSEASLPHLMEGANGGMRFFGRPIGNALALTADGTSVNQSNNECIYCSTETGDFFEYVFTLNAEQANTLSTARLYCDARPADHLDQNGGDFWAYGRNSTDWTPGYYIDGADEHVQKNDDGTVKMVKDHERAVKQEDGSYAEGVETETEVKMGARIEDYRYILYVDGNPVDFDEDTKVPVKGSGTNMQRAEYVLPYTFHLHEGKNTISLRMAGGYRSEFYNFIFRPYVEPTQITVNQDKLEMKVDETAQITSTFTELTYQSANAQIATVDENGLVKGIKAGETTITISKEGNFKAAKLPVKVNEKEGVITLNLTDGVINPAEGGVRVYNSSSSGTWYREFKKDATVTYTFQAAAAGKYNIQLGLRGSNIVLADNFAIKVNDADVALSGTVNTSYDPVDYVVGQADLKVGENTMVITALADCDLYLKTLKLIPAGDDPLPHEHAFGTPTAQTDEVESSIASCECGVTQIRWDAKKYNTTQSSDKVSTNEATGVSGDTNKGIKLGGDVYNKASGTESAGTHVNYNVNVPAAKTGAKLIIRGVRNSSSAASMFSAMSNDNSPSYYQKEDGTWAKYEWRYKLFINGEEVAFTPYTSDEPQAPSKQYAEAAFPCTFDLKAGNNTIEIQKWGGYTLVITEFALEF